MVTFLPVTTTPTSPTAAADRAAGSPVRRLSAHLGMLAVVCIWGANFSITKLALAEIPPLAFTAIRFTLGTVFFWALVRQVEGRVPLPPRSIGTLVWLGVVGNTLYQLGFMLGLARTTASNSALILASMPTVVAVLAGLLGIESTPPRVRVGIGIATVGVVLVIAVRGVGFSERTLTGDLLTVGGVLCWAAYTLGLRRLRGGLSPLRITAVTTATGTPGLLLAGIPELIQLDWSAVAPGAWAGLAYATILSLGLAYYLWNTSVRAIGPSRTVVYMCLTPVIAVLVAWLALGERPAPLQAVGAVLILGGVILTRRERGRPPGSSD